MRGSAAHGMGIEKEVLIPMELQVGVKVIARRGSPRHVNIPRVRDTYAARRPRARGGASETGGRGRKPRAR